MNKEEEKYLHSLYYDPARPSSFSSPNKIYQTIKKENKYNITYSNVLKWYRQQETYGLHHRIQRRFRRNRFISHKLDYIWDCDLCDMSFYQKDNNKYKYILVVIDTFSRFAFTRSLKTKTANDVLRAFKNIFQNTNRHPDHIRTDQGSEFCNSLLNKYLKSKGINHFVTQNTEIKAHIAERFLRTLKSKITKYMYSKQSHKWFNKLQLFTKSYNNTVHRSIKTTPASVTEKDNIRIWKLLYDVPHSTRTFVNPPHYFKFAINDIVRISLIKRAFEKEYDVRWSLELFIIIKRQVKGRLAKYVLKDFQNELVSGEFYESELLKVSINKDTDYKIETVLGRRKRKGKTEVLVKWLNYSSAFNSWIPSDYIKNYS